MNKIIKTFLILAILTGCNKQNSLSQIAWEHNINNPENREYVVEVAFNENVEICNVTQQMFNERYNVGK